MIIDYYQEGVNKFSIDYGESGLGTLQTHDSWIMPNCTIASMKPIQADVILLAENGKPVLTIKADGTVIWNGYEVQSEQEFREAMIEVSKIMRGL